MGVNVYRYGVSVVQDEKVLDVDGSDDHPTMCVQLLMYT
jgi:hypothetical protein